MAKTRWRMAWGVIDASGTQQVDVLIGDTFEDNEVNLYTVLKIIGQVWTRSKTLTGDAQLAWGIRVGDRQVAATNEVSPNAAANGVGAEDDEGFWITKGVAQFWDNEDNVTRDPPVYVDTTSRRVVRETEDLKIVVTREGSEDIDLQYAFRILVLEG